MNRRELLRSGIAGLLTMAVPKGLLAGAVAPKPNILPIIDNYVESVLANLKPKFEEWFLKGHPILDEVRYQSATSAIMLANYGSDAIDRWLGEEE